MDEQLSKMQSIGMQTTDITEPTMSTSSVTADMLAAQSIINQKMIEDDKKSKQDLLNSLKDFVGKYIDTLSKFNQQRLQSAQNTLSIENQRINELEQEINRAA